MRKPILTSFLSAVTPAASAGYLANGSFDQGVEKRLSLLITTVKEKPL